MALGYTYFSVSNDDLMQIGIVCLGILVGLLIIGVLILAVSKAYNKSKPIEQATAKIIEKTAIPNNAIFVRVLFQTEDGKRLLLSAKISANYTVGDVGQLVWRGNQLMDFKVNR